MTVLVATVAQTAAETVTQSSGGGSDLLTAVLGGSIGFLLGVIGRSLGIPSDTRTNDAAVGDRDNALATWVADRNLNLRRLCEAIRRGIPREPPPAPSRTLESKQARANYESTLASLDQQIADARAGALHEYRDEARRARLDVARITANEGWSHRQWRRMTRRPVPDLETPNRAEPVLDAWRKPSSLGAAQVWPEDATQRTLTDAIDSMPATGP